MTSGKKKSCGHLRTAANRGSGYGVRKYSVDSTTNGWGMDDALDDLERC